MSIEYEKENLYAFGAGLYGERCIELVTEMGGCVTAVMDNSNNKQGTEINGVKVIKPIYNDKARVIISSLRYERDIYKQLLELGYRKEDIIIFDELIEDFSKTFNKRKNMVMDYPNVIQMPITNKCNMNCVMCGVSKHVSEEDITPEQYGIILKDRLFKDVKAIGINGGEPFLRKDLIECIKVCIVSLPKLKEIYIITNGYFTKTIEEKLPIVYTICKTHGVKLTVSISVDGVGRIHNEQRRVSNAFEYTNKTCEMILNDKERFVDELGVICTITKNNIARINEVVLWSEKYNLAVNYNIATENRRIDNSDRVEEFSVFADEKARALATEFIYAQYIKTGKVKYFAMFLYLRTGKRHSNCPHRTNDWITLLPDGSVSYCAPRSKKLGVAIDQSAYYLVKNNTDYLRDIYNHCEKCGQYISDLDFTGKEKMYSDMIENNSSRW